jgi:hypothetical protein
VVKSPSWKFLIYTILKSTLQLFQTAVVNNSNITTEVNIVLTAGIDASSKLLIDIVPK